MIAVLLASLCLFGSGCCTYVATRFTAKHFRDDCFMTERTSVITEDNSLVVDVNMDIRHHYLPNNMHPAWSTHRKRSFKLPLTSPPSSAETFILDVEVEDSPQAASRTSSFPFNRKYEIINNRYENVTDKPFPLKRYSALNNQDVYSTHLIQIKAHPEDIPELYKPFVVYIKDYTENSGQRIDSNTYLMVPYKREGNRFHIYSAANRSFNSLLVEPSEFIGSELNTCTYLSWVVIVPPALVIDVVTLPFQVAGVLIFIAGMSNLGP